MKTNIMISVDVEVIAEARNKIGNVSAFCNAAMREVMSLPDRELPNDPAQLKSIIAGKSAELAELKKHLDKASEERNIKRTIE